MSKYSTVVFTVFQYETLETFINELQCDWALAQEERTQDGKPHIQGMAYTKNQSRWTQLKKLKVHHEKCKSPLDSIVYCTKEESRISPPYEKGTRPTWNKKGQKLSNMELLSMKPDQALEENHIHWRDYEKFKKIQVLYKQDKVEEKAFEYKKRGLWCYGETRTGKSTFARKSKPYLKSLNKWFDNYQGQEDMLIEDVDKSHAEWIGSFLKIWADNHPFPGETKGGRVDLQPFSMVFVTSNYHPNELWEDKNMIDPLLERFKIMEFKKLQKNDI